MARLKPRPLETRAKSLGQAWRAFLRAPIQNLYEIRRNFFLVQGNFEEQKVLGVSHKLLLTINKYVLQLHN
jgi:hypothetical protein